LLLVHKSTKLVMAEAAASLLMARHGLGNWLFRFNSRCRHAGVCFFPTSGHQGRIELSAHFCDLNTLEEVRSTILHEIAHALAFLETGHKGHGQPWKAACGRVGADPTRCYTRDKVKMPIGKWRASCPHCKTTHHFHRKPKRLSGWYCKACGKEKGPLTWQAAVG
jgi:predicted SprT family Zn-dependent metalloprotease